LDNPQRQKDAAEQQQGWDYKNKSLFRNSLEGIGIESFRPSCGTLDAGNMSWTNLWFSARSAHKSGPQSLE
jgi:hypothetical protein